MHSLEVLKKNRKMGVELHITRADHWSDNDHCKISISEWLDFVSSDPELRLNPENGTTFTEWLGKSEYEEPWLDWSIGNISTKWLDTALYEKMLEIAKALNATVQDDDGNRYPDEAQWEFNPNKGF